MTKRGRPSEYTEAIADRICEELANARSLRSICLDDGMPHQATVFRWLADERYSAFCEQYARAREAQADAIADEMLDIADDAVNDYVEKERPDGTKHEAFDSEHVQRSKLRIDTRKWLAAKLKPTKYGDHLDVTTGGQPFDLAAVVAARRQQVAKGRDDE